MNMSWFNKKTNASYNFVAPAIEKHENKTIEVMFPAATADTVTLASNAAVVDVALHTNIIKLGTLAAASSLTLKPSADLGIGARVIVTWTEPATAVGCALVVGEDTIAAATATKGANSAAVAKELMWDGSSFILL